MALLSFAPSILLIAGLIVLFGGFVKGVAGFGYALVSTTLLAALLNPATAVVIMIVPMLAASLSLVRELEPTELRTCITRFWPYVLAASVGTAIGMLLIDAIPKHLMLFGLGLFTLAYVAGKQPYVAIPGEPWFRERCFRPSTPAKAALGFVSGLLFGSANVAVQVVAYLDSLSLDRHTFVGVLAMILVGISSLRIGIAWTLGMYDAGSLFFLSILLAIPGLLGVSVGRRLRTSIPDRVELLSVLGLLTIIGFRLVTNGLQGS